jgi:Cu/Ag efflux protein CusF
MKKLEARPFTSKGVRAIWFEIRRYSMKSSLKWFSALAVLALLTGTAAAANTVSAGKVKSINADKKTFVLTDTAGKDHTFKFGDNLVINRGGKESQTDLKDGDAVSVAYDRGLFTWKAHYILVQEGSTKNCTLMQGNVKSYDADRKELTFTDQNGKTWTFAMGDAKVRLNMQDAKVENIKIGDHTLFIVETIGDNATLKSVMVDRR